MNTNTLRKEDVNKTPSLTETKKHVSALRIVDTKKLDYQQWLDIRKNGIGSSDAAAAIGLNPYKSQLELWMEKTNRSAGLPQIDPKDDKHPTYWGTILEPIVAVQYSRKTGNRIRRVNAVLQHPKYPFMLANIDREVLGNDEVQILECKTTGINGIKLWKNGIPEYVQLQVMHQLAVTGKRAADVAVLVGGNDLQTHRVERNEAMIEKLIQLENQFWHYVVSDTSPPADASDSADIALRCLFPIDNGETLDLTNDADINHVFDELIEVKDQQSDLYVKEKALKHRIQQLMGDHSKAEFRGGNVTWKKSSDSQSINTKALLKDYPDLAMKYSIHKTGSRRFLVNAS